MFPEQIGLLERRTPEARITSAQLRIWTNDFILDFADRIEEAADRIKAQESAPEIRRNSLLWKINATQAGFRAASRRDALIAFADVWILCRQMTVFFEVGGGEGCRSVIRKTSQSRLPSYWKREWKRFA